MKDRISDIILQGLVTDLYRTERAIFIHKEIGQYSELINNSESSIKKIFILMQSFCFNEAILSLSRVYDYPSSKYENRCVRRLIEILKESGDNALPISETCQTLEQIRYFRIPKMVEEYLMQRDHIQFSKYLSWHFEFVIIQSPFQDKIKQLKEIRDKTLAHNEIVNEVKSIKWTTFDELIDFVKMVVGIVGWAYLSTVYMLNGKHLLTEDAEREKYVIRNMLKELKILNEA